MRNFIRELLNKELRYNKDQKLHFRASKKKLGEKAESKNSKNNTIKEI